MLLGEKKTKTVFQERTGGVSLYPFWILDAVVGNEVYPRKFFLMLIFFQGKVAVGSSHRQFREIKSGCCFDVFCAETALMSLSWWHGWDDHILTVLEKMINWGIPEEFSLGTCNFCLILKKMCMIIDSFVDKWNFWNQ